MAVAIVIPVIFFTLLNTVLWTVQCSKLLCKIRYQNGVLIRECVCNFKKMTPKFKDPDSTYEKAVQKGVIARDSTLRMQYISSKPP